MESSESGWWRRHGWTVALLLTAFGIAFAIRTIWTYPVVAQWGPLFTYAGGSDSYYHSRVMAYIALNHTNLIQDPLLKFPVGEINPREPLFDWMNGILGVVFAPAFGGNPVVAGAWFLDLQAPLWAALTVFPIYLIGREVSSRRTGLVAAFIYPFLSGSIDSTIFGYANYLSFYTFIILVVVYSYLRTVKAVGSRRWVEDYRQPRSVLAGLRGFLRTERTAVKWAVFTGVSVGALALAWQGFTYAIVVIAISLLVSMVVERVRRVDSFGLYISAWIVGLVAFPMAMPYYLVQQQFHVWFDLPLLLYFGTLLLLLPFLFVREWPWIFSVPLLGGLFAAGAGVLYLVSPAYLSNVVSGQGYFVKNLIYSTVAEAQAPSVDALIIAYGVVTFFLAFVGVAIFLYLLVRGRFKRVHVVFLVFAILSIYLPISAAKFFLLGSPIFALLPAEAIVRAIDIAGYPELRRTVASLSDRRSQFSAFRKAFKARHVLVLALVIGLLLPNIWIAIDAGIPGNTKSQFSSQVASTLPTWLQPNRTNPSQYYFGAAGTQLDTPNQYDSAAYNWLAQQDTNRPASQRPAFVSWWDYGFQAIDQGNHPSVADNFQNGIDPAGQFLLSQNESQAIAILATTLLQAEQKKTGLTYLPGPVNRILAQNGLNVGEVHSLLANTSNDYSLVVNHPERYLPVNPSTLTDDNAMYLAMAYYLSTSLPISGIAQVYDQLEAYTGWSISYAMSDSRLFPFGPLDTGIFYAPADLTGRVISSGGIPTTFFNVTVITNEGTFPAGQVPPGATVLNYSINYFAPFYSSMIYHIYIGYNGTQAGLGPGIPGFGGSAAGVSPILPGWMLQHFQVVYKTAYYCAQKNVTSGSSCFAATNYPTAVGNAASAKGGTADTSFQSYFSGGESILQYYPGQPYLGSVVLPDGTPVAGARVTVADSWGIPHMTTLTGKDGSFSLVLPPGNDTVNVTVGALNGLRQQGATVLKTLHIDVPQAIGLSDSAPTLVQTIPIGPATVQGFVYWNSSNTSGFVPAVDALIPGAQIVLWGTGNVSRITTTTDASGAFTLSSVPAGVYNYDVLYGGRNYSEGSFTVAAGATHNATVGLAPGVFEGRVWNADLSPVVGATVVVSNASGPVAATLTNGTGQYRIDTVGAGNYTVTASGPEAGWRSNGVPVYVPSPGATASTNLTVRPTSTVTVSLTSGGAPAGGIPVRFVPVAVYNASTSPIATVSGVQANATVVLTGTTGRATVTLAPGVYSVYAVGYVGSTLEAGVGNATVVLGAPTFGSLALSPAVRLSGAVSATSAPGNRTAVTVYAATGGSVETWASANGSYSLLLPVGRYTVYSVTGPSQGTADVLAAIASVDLTTAQSVSLSPVRAITSAFTVGSPLANGTLFPAGNATVEVTPSTVPTVVPGVADPSGRVALFLPSVLPAGGTYCLRASAFGFASASSCGITPNGLQALSRFPIVLENVSVSLSVVGLPSGTSVSVSITAQSESATNRTLSGGPNFSFSLPPGTYGVGARAKTSSGTLYLPSSTFTTVIPIGASSSTWGMLLLPQVNAKGTVVLPSPSDNLSQVYIELSSPVLNITLSGTQFSSGFSATPGNYTAYSNLTSSGITFSNLTRITIGSNGAVSFPLVLDRAGVPVTGSLVNATGARAPVTASLTLTTSLGGSLGTTVTDGNFSIVLPANVTYYGHVNATAGVAGPNGTYYERWTNAAGASCTPTASSMVCALTMVGTVEPVWLNGTLTSAGVTGNVSGTLTVMGPYPSDQITVVPAPSGAFSLSVRPGAYELYATGSVAGATRAAFGSTVVLPADQTPVNLSLLPTWTATIQLAPPNGSSAGVSPVTLALRDDLGHWLVYSGLSPTASMSLALPAGTYALAANATGTFQGVPSGVTATQSLTVANGNAGALLSLQYVLVAQVAGAIVGAPTATVSAGQSVTFGFSVANTGNVPITVDPVGTPSYWRFNFSFASVTLAPGSNASGEVTIFVPAGTSVNHPTVTIEFTDRSGKVLGSVSPSPTVNVVGYYGVGVGPAASSVQVGTNRTVVPFYVDNTGNDFETVSLSVVDAPRLVSMGWSVRLTGSSGGPVSTATLAPGENSTYYVRLNATGAVFLAPGSVTVSAAVVNSSGSVQTSAQLTIGAGTLRAQSPSGAPVAVSGPSVGSPPSLPDWLIPLLSFVPAIALGLGLVTYRWWRTRRWTHR